MNIEYREKSKYDDKWLVQHCCSLATHQAELHNGPGLFMISSKISIGMLQVKLFALRHSSKVRFHPVMMISFFFNLLFLVPLTIFKKCCNFIVQKH